jgi:hypothetical protein
MLRLCVDYRALNSITVKNRCTIPRIDDLLDAVAGSQYFTSLDWTSNYQDGLMIAHMLYLVVKRPRTCRTVKATRADLKPRHSDHTLA